MTLTIAWVLNLDADLELADPRGYAPSDRQRARTLEQGRLLLASARGRAPPGVRHERIEDLDPETAAVCQAWCPTPRAIGQAAAQGRRLVGPDCEVLQRVNHRGFAAALAGVPFLRSIAELEGLLRTGDRWLLQRPFGFSGRGSKAVGAELTAAERTWVEASMRDHDGLQVRPFVTVEAELAVHGWLDPGGAVLRGEPVGFVCDARRAFARTTAAPDLAAADARRIAAAFDRCAAALRDAGYHGPFSVDALRYRNAAGQSAWQPLSEVNARYSMGWFEGVAQAPWVRGLSA